MFIQKTLSKSISLIYTFRLNSKILKLEKVSLQKTLSVLIQNFQNYECDFSKNTFSIIFHEETLSKNLKR